MRRILIHVAAIVGLSCGAVAQGDTLTVGTAVPINGHLPVNSIPFNANPGPLSSGQTMAYEQIYNATAFPGPIDITSISFFQTIDTSNTNILAGNYSFSFLTTTTPVGDLTGCQPISCISGSTPPQLFYNGTIASATSGSPLELTITGSTPFVYDPSQGQNLLLYIVAQGQPVATYGFLDADVSGQYASGTLMSRAYFIGNNTGVPDGIGLVTMFTYMPVPVPEPASWALFVLGALALLALSRRTPLKHSTRIPRAGALPA